MIFLALAIFILVGVLLYSAYDERSRFDKLALDVKAGNDLSRKALAFSNDLDDKLSTIKNDFNLVQNEHSRDLKKLKQDTEILQVRQHGLEKKIVSAERTVNLVFRGPIPVENVPHTIIKQKKGRGRAALIKEI